MDKVIYAIAWAFSLLPLRVLYWMADCAFVLVYYIARYRRSLVRSNLAKCFPDKDKKERIRIERRFYHHFCNIFVETIKTLSMSDEEMARRFVFENGEILDQYYEQRKSLILTLGHFGNWEWITFAQIARHPLHPEFTSYSVYHELEGGVMDKFYLRLRSRSQSVLVPRNKLLRALVNQRKTGEPAMYCFIADQGPLNEAITFWMKWLNRETAPIIGPEKIARQTGFDILYIDVKVIRRGYYSARFIPLPLGERPYDLTRLYMRHMEQTILRKPEYWLWTHNRWKRHRKGWEQLMRTRGLEQKIQEAADLDEGLDNAIP